MFYHLEQIDKLYEATEISRKKLLWHFFWAKTFYFLNIPNEAILFRATIIHLTQTYIAFFALYFFSHVIIRNLFIKIDKLTLQYLSLWSVLIWFTIFATYSMSHHLVWNMWYSVNYQITLPLFWYITALTLVLIAEETSIRKKIFFILQILIISRFILQAHSMEFLYYFIYLFIFSIIFLDKIIYFTKKYIYLVIPMLIIITYFITNIQSEVSPILKYLHYEKLPLLYESIVTQGQILTGNNIHSHASNRAFVSINELMYLIGFISFIMSLLIVLDKKYKNQLINTKMFIFLILTSMLVLIPLFEFSSGLFAIVTRTNIVNRLYYISSLFIVIPVFVYYILYLHHKGKTKLITINITIVFILASVYFYSKYDISHTQNYYKNIQSIKNSFSREKVGFNLSDEHIHIIGEKLKYYETHNKIQKPIYYYARDDISFVIKFIYRKEVLWNRKGNRDYAVSYEIDKNDIYHSILFETPQNFPAYRKFN